MEDIEKKQTRKRSKKEGEVTFDDKYLAKLERYRNHMAKVRLNETPEQYKARLERARVHAAKSRQNETPEQRAARLERARIYKLESRRNETPEQRRKRLESARKQTLRYRQQQTAEQREIRLQRARMYNYQVRHNESPEQREARLEYTRRYMTQMRRYKIFAGMIDQADKDQWEALQALMNTTESNHAVNNLQPETSEIGTYDDNSTSAPDSKCSQWSLILETQLLKTANGEIKMEEQNNNSMSYNSNLNENLPTEPKDLFLFNSITSNIPPLQDEVEMVLSSKVLKQAEYACPHCKKAYRYPHGLKKHLRIQHSIE